MYQQKKKEAQVLIITSEIIVTGYVDITGDKTASNSYNPSSLRVNELLNASRMFLPIYSYNVLKTRMTPNEDEKIFSYLQESETLFFHKHDIKVLASIKE